VGDIITRHFVPKMTFWCGMRQATFGSRAALYACYKQNLAYMKCTFKLERTTCPRHYTLCLKKQLLNYNLSEIIIANIN